MAADRTTGRSRPATARARKVPATLLARVLPFVIPDVPFNGDVGSPPRVRLLPATAGAGCGTDRGAREAAGVMSTRKGRGFVPKQRPADQPGHPASKNRVVAAKYGRLAAESARSGAELAAAGFRPLRGQYRAGHAQDLLRKRVADLRLRVRRVGEVTRVAGARLAREALIENGSPTDSSGLRASGQYPVVMGPYPNGVRTGKRGPTPGYRPDGVQCESMVCVRAPRRTLKGRREVDEAADQGYEG